MSDDPADEERSEESTEARSEHRTEDTMTDSEPDDEPAREATDESRSDLRRNLNYALLAGLALVALIATLQFYVNVTSAINQWIAHEYRSLFQAAFNLAVLLLVSGGIVWQTRRLQSE